MVGNDSSHHLKMFGEVSKPLSAEMSKIFKSRPKYKMGLLLSLLKNIIFFCNFANYQLSCFTQCQQSVQSDFRPNFRKCLDKTSFDRMRKTDI